MDPIRVNVRTDGPGESVRYSPGTMIAVFPIRDNTYGIVQLDKSGHFIEAIINDIKAIETGEEGLELNEIPESWLTRRGPLTYALREAYNAGYSAIGLPQPTDWIDDNILNIAEKLIKGVA